MHLLALQTYRPRKAVVRNDCRAAARRTGLRRNHVPMPVSVPEQLTGL